MTAVTRDSLIHAVRRLAGSDSEWKSSFACEDMSVLIVCRGPIRQEALDVFAEMGMSKVGILLSEKDSIVYPRALAPELRRLEPARVHPVSDYSGATRQERLARIAEIIGIAKEHEYEYVFAGYGFMAEDEEFVRSLENAGLKFMGPCSHTVAAAGFKDEAKRTALQQNVSVTPGVDDVTARLLVAKCKDLSGLKKLAKDKGLAVDFSGEKDVSLEVVAERVLQASYSAGMDLYSIDELCTQVSLEVSQILAKHPGRRLRLKAIGGGGGKGQRILSSAAEAPGCVREVLGEVKTTGVGDNKNVLIELNIETTRHNEIQLLGNGQWCISLGGRDCSLQMHEQKLVEVSMTQESLSAAVDEQKRLGNHAAAKAIGKDLTVLQRMEEEAARFGTAVKLDSVSTFECIVDGDTHYFMEVNTRIQVEHRVTELCYSLRFSNPKNPKEYFDVHSLVEAMALLARHKTRLPKPERVPRHNASIEIRLNATDRSLSPHAGGEILFWSDPKDGEVRDDQGICYKNPDTGLFVRYRLAGAYDSNIALLLAVGASRELSYQKIWEILRRTELRGPDLQTNLCFHYGIISWFLAHNVYAKPTTKFIVPYLNLVGLLKEISNQVNLVVAFEALRARYAKNNKDNAGLLKACHEIFELKQTLIVRPLERLIEDPNLLAAWLSTYRSSYAIENGKVRWLQNPIEVLQGTYFLINMDHSRRAPAAHRVWDNDQETLDEANAFYAAIQAQAQKSDWQTLEKGLNSEKPQWGYEADTWQEIRRAHLGFQMGFELLGLLPLIGRQVRFDELRVDEDLNIVIPDFLQDPALSARLKRVLVPPPRTKSDEIVAVSGGMFYSQEAPGMPSFVKEGHHFQQGEPLYVIEVMKMFNKVTAPFAGRIDKILVENDGTIVSKGQPLFKVTPDETITHADPAEVERAMKARTEEFVAVL